MNTSTAAASRSPQARSFQISTMAMHRARPTMISPVRYSGWSGRNAQARANISAGPMIQFSTRDRASSRLSPVTRWVSSYRTLASTGYIITSSPRAIGRDIPITWTDSSAWFRPGTRAPRASPAPMASRIQTARKRSRKDIRAATGASVGADCGGAVVMGGAFGQGEGQVQDA